MNHPVLRIGHKVIKPEQTYPVIEPCHYSVRDKLTAQQLDGLLDQLPRGSTLHYCGKVFHEDALSEAREARREFHEAQDIVRDCTRPREEVIAAAKIMGRKMGIWNREFASPFYLPLQQQMQVLIHKIPLRDLDICKEITAGFREELTGANSDEPMTFHCSKGRYRLDMRAEETCTLFECHVYELQRQLAKPAVKSVSKKPGRKTRARTSDKR